MTGAGNHFGIISLLTWMTMDHWQSGDTPRAWGLANEKVWHWLCLHPSGLETMERPPALKRTTKLEDGDCPETTWQTCLSCKAKAMNIYLTVLVFSSFVYLLPDDPRRSKVWIFGSYFSSSSSCVEKVMGFPKETMNTLDSKVLKANTSSVKSAWQIKSNPFPTRY